MKLYAPLFAVLLAAPAFAQTATTEGDTMSATDQAELSTRVGSTFFSDDAMTTLRPSADIQAQWSTLSPADQDALRARCTALIGMEPSKGDGSGDATATDAGSASDSSSGSDSTEAADQSDTTTAEDMGFIMDDVRMRPVCEAIAGL